MSRTKNLVGSSKSRPARVIKVAAVTRAVRAALAISVTALALGGPMVASAAPNRLPLAWAGAPAYVFPGLDAYPTVDLTLARIGDIPTSVIALQGPMTIDVIQAGDVSYTNAGAIVVTATGTDNISAIHAESTDGGNVSVDNQAAGTLDATSESGYAIGIFGATNGGDVDVQNAGTITATSSGGIADGIFATGTNVDVDNSGSITADGFSWAAGIEAQGDDLTTVSNSGDITASAYGNDEATGTYGHAYGIFATGGAGGISIDNSGDITSQGIYATGIYAYDGAGGDITISNSGNMQVNSPYYATGIQVVSGGDGAVVSIDNTGTVYANSVYGSIGIQAVATGDGSSVSVTNSGDVEAVVANKYGSSIGILASSIGDASIDNSGNVLARDNGLMALSFAGDASVTNSGYVSGVTAITASSLGGVAQVDNSGEVHSGAVSINLGTFEGIRANGAYGVTVANSGSVYVAGMGGRGVYATTDMGDAVVTNSGSISVQAKYGYGVVGIASAGDVSLTNTDTGTIDVSGKYFPAEGEGYSPVSMAQTIAGMVGITTLGDVTINNAGSVLVDATGLTGYAGRGFGLLARSSGGNVSVGNSGTLDVTAYLDAQGVLATAAGDVTVGNSGTITVLSTGNDAIGVYANATDGTAAVTNAGTITATSTYGLGTGVQAVSTGDIVVNNSGQISATGVDQAIAVSLDADGVATLNNSGVIRSYATQEGSIAVLGSDGVQEINNTGKIYGVLSLGGGADVLTNGNQGLWDVRSLSSDFGAGDDKIDNQAGGTILLADAAFTLGSGDNAFNNAGTIKVQGTGLIDMGSGPDAAAVPSLNVTPLVNDGVIDFLDGAPDDLLTIVGDLGGSGALSLDMSFLNNASDMLYVDGSIASGAAQHVNLAFTGDSLTSILNTQVQFASVSGDSTAGSFVGGDVLGFSADNFVTLGVGITSNIDASNATADAFYAQIDVSGLGDAGVLAASVGAGAQSLLASQVGTWRQRMGVVPASGGKTGLSPWVRVFHDKRDVDPRHDATFGQGGNFAFEQTNRGTELGLDFAPATGVNLGVTLGDNEGRQNLLGEGVGRSRFDGHTLGLYGTFTAAKGYYVDVSYRAMRFDARLRSEGSDQFLHGKAGAFNVEAGYDWTLGNGLKLEPQLQYTRTTVDGVGPLQATNTTFRSRDTEWETTRLGLAAFKSFASKSGLVWTPYGAVSAVHTSGGRSDYAINDTLLGSTRTDGDSTLVELGLGMGWKNVSVTGGLNWADGDSTLGRVGGQLVLRYGF